MPLVILTGGPAAYWHALFDQGAEDLGNIQMLWTTHGVRDVRDALYYAFVAPWAAWPVAAVVADARRASASSRLARRQRRALALLAVAFGPYLVFDLLFQETFTSRYALPLVVPIAYLAVAGLRLLPCDIGLAVAIAAGDVLARTSAAPRSPPIRAQPAPAFRLLDDMRAAASTASRPPVLAPDRRECVRPARPRKWLGDCVAARRRRRWRRRRSTSGSKR